MKQFLIWEDFATYRGEIFSTHRHSHFFIQISIPDSGSVGLRTIDGEWKSYNVVCIPSGISHEMRGGEGNLTLLYLDPLTTGYQLFFDRSLASNHTAFEVGDVFTENLKQQIRDILKSSNKDVRVQLLEMINKNFDQQANRKMDPRIQKSMQDVELDRFSLSHLAKEASLSVERYRHLFRQEAGVPFSAFKLWLKTKKAVDYLANHSHLSNAAYEGGFADQSHFTRIFRRSFGVSPSDFTKKKEPFQAIFFSK
ncbi:AraC family transcriptional regulator [Leptospira montravelensis]|uniref:AraC family transcriptional regulator n=1 Tax=Leptospira montravelensis TaxID=2484961 RepID=A0ABY2LYJ7_9LEPT|nr:helix-turn-helix domain-containing protein [Leptospira montravelensis]TGK84190.1 AraC family transcriptional regulator [Leptospira montravelensis]TGL06200.1 AraC family transcriptional regulator [Leptospira montravelensis]